MSSDQDNAADSGRAKGASGRLFRLFVLAAFAVVVLSLMGLSCFGRRALDRQLASIKAAGEPLTLSELQASLPEIPDETNSALILLELVDQLQPIQRGDEQRKLVPLAGDAETVRWGEAWPAETVRAVEDYLAEKTPVLAELDRIHDMPEGRFPITYDPAKPILDQLSPGGDKDVAAAVRFAAKLEALATMRDALNGSPEAGLQRLETIVNIGASLANESMLVSALCVLSMEDLAVQTSQFVLSTTQATPEQLTALAHLWERAEKRYVMPAGLRGERVVMRAFVADSRKGRVGDNPNAGDSREAVYAAFSWVASGWFDKNEAKSLALFDPLIEAGDRVEDALAAARNLEQQLDELSRFYLLASISLPSLERSMELWARHDARLRCARAALAAERFRIDTGNWPESLDALVPDYLDAVPSDPFAGVPVRYVQRDGGIIVYSVGENGTDDGGELETESRKKERPRDVGFRMAAPDQRIVRIESP